MNLEQELDKVTAPLPKASGVKRLPPDEIERLVADGKITPIDKILKQHPWGPEKQVSVRGCGRGRYDH